MLHACSTSHKHEAQAVARGVLVLGRHELRALSEKEALYGGNVSTLHFVGSCG